MDTQAYTIKETDIASYVDYLEEQERAAQTIQKYLHGLRKLQDYLCGKPMTKSILVEWKEQLAGTHAPASVNAMLVAVNGFLSFMGWHKLTMRLVKIQKTLFCDEKRELSRAEYIRLVNTAKKGGNHRLSLVLQTICATGIRVSELKYITVEAVCAGRTLIRNKGKQRVVFLPEKLCRLLKKYLHKQKRIEGAVFVTRNGRPLNRSNIWRDMKALCESAGVESSKVFPHNLRHLFARTYYSMERDLSRLADILGHSSVNTTRIYTAESGTVHARQIGRMGLILS